MTIGRSIERPIGMRRTGSQPGYTNQPHESRAHLAVIVNRNVCTDEGAGPCEFPGRISGQCHDFAGFTVRNEAYTHGIDVCTSHLAFAVRFVDDTPSFQTAQGRAKLVELFQKEGITNG